MMTRWETKHNIYSVADDLVQGLDEYIGFTT